ncbi:hypothetical protein [Arcanobacterium buesumense]|uniref:Uncharacterized protein n=1 Tax=Arcanobacterium buesumense TaxID=2722751 RepID=A0A6H2EL49_9ACTO|nr:hypothetical protein [Arcanobacterium buesumense]QJC21873.1 hypothetical protein HC352_04720 [Arcanobacterium buesumense]
MNSAHRYLILTTFQDPQVVAAILTLRSISAMTLPTDSGVVVMHDIPVKSFDDWDISELLGTVDKVASEDISFVEDSDNADISDQPELVAAMLSRLSPYGVVLLTAQLGDDIGAEEGTSGLVSAVRFIDGQRDEDIPAGLLLNVIDPVIELLMLGQTDPATLPGVVAELSVEEVAQILGEQAADEDKDDA